MPEEKSARDRILESAARLLQEQGYHATGLKQIVKESDAPMGSVYHYFPDGKEGLASEAVERTQRTVAQNIQSTLDAADTFSEGMHTFIYNLAAYMETRSATDDHGSISTIAMESPNVGEQLRTTCEGAYESWRLIFKQAILKENFAEQDADDLSTIITGAIEGGLVLSKVRQNASALRTTAKMLLELVEKKRPI